MRGARSASCLLRRDNSIDMDQSLLSVLPRIRGIIDTIAQDMRGKRRVRAQPRSASSATPRLHVLLISRNSVSMGINKCTAHPPDFCGCVHVYIRIKW